MKKIILTVGLNDKETLLPVCKTFEAIGTLQIILSHHMDNCTFVPCSGFYRHLNGQLTRENSIKVEFNEIEQCRLLKIIKLIKQAFNQETLLMECFEVESELV